MSALRSSKNASSALKTGPIKCVSARKPQQKAEREYEIIFIREYNECSLPADLAGHGIPWASGTMIYHCIQEEGFLIVKEICEGVCLGTCVLLTPWVGWGLQVWSQKTLWPPRTGRCRLAAEWGPACTKISGNLNTQTDTHNHFSAQGGQPEDKNVVHLTWPQVFMSVLILILPCNAWFPIERTKAVLKKSQNHNLPFFIFW